MIHIQLCWAWNVQVELDRGYEVLAWQSQHVGDLALGGSNVGPSQLGNLGRLQCAIDVVEALRLIAGSRRQILEWFELPISPSDEQFVADLGHLPDLARAHICVHACTELRDDQRDAQSLRVTLARFYSSGMPKLALHGLVFSWLAGVLTHRAVKHGEIAAIRMLVENVGIGADFASRRTGESDLINQAISLIVGPVRPEGTKNIWESCCLEEHYVLIDGRWVIRLVGLE